MRARKILVLCLTVCMMVTMLPTFTLPAAAATSDDTDISEMNALDALGIDTSEVPDGVDLDSTDNPYGRNTTTVNPVYELFVQGNSTSTLYGHNKAVGKTWEDFYTSQGVPKNNVTTGSYAASATASGNFNKNTTGNTGQTVTVAAGTLSKNGGLYMYFSDPVDNTKGTSTIELLSTSKKIGNTDNQMDENFLADPYLMKNYLQITAGDYDGDGVDEVAVYVAQQGNSRVEIYDLQIDDTFSTDNASTYYLNTSHWAKAWTYYFNESPYVSNMVSLTSGDVNLDGTDDLALTWGYYYGPAKYTNSKAVILCGSQTGMLQKSMSIDLNHGSSQIVRAAFNYGDVDGDNVNDLILGGQLNSDISSGNLYSRFVAVYNYNGDSDSFIQSVAQNFDLFAKEENDAGEETYVNMVMSEHGDIFFSLPTMVANISAVNMQGIGHASNIYIDSLIIEYGDEGLAITAALDHNGYYNTYVNTDYADWVRSTNGRFYTEYSVVAADYTSDTKQTLQVILNYSAEAYSRTVSYVIPFYKSWWFGLWYINSWETVSTEQNFSLPADTVMAAVEGELTAVKDPTTQAITGYNFDMNVKSSQVNFATSFCKLNSDNDTSYISFTNEHGVIYSDPEAMAVLASAPYFKDLSSDGLSGSYMESSTSYSSTTGNGTEETTSHTLSIGAYISYQHDFEVSLGITTVKVGGMETELSYTHGWTWETTESSMVEMTISYETVVGQDSVVFYSIPMEYYIFDSYVPVINETSGLVTGYDLQKMSVNLPHTAAVTVLSLEKYEKIAADYDELPQISGLVLTHTVGRPSTYPTSSAGYSNVIEYDGNWAGVDYSAVGASVTQEIAISEEDADGLTNTNTVDFQIGAGPGDFIFGVTAGYEHGSSKVTITSKGSTYSGSIYNMPAEAEEYGYYYAWKLFTYTCAIGDSTIPVVSYMVKDVTAPPSLPEDFAQESTLTTDEALGLTWSYPSASAISGFQIYRHYEFPDGSGSYELAFIPASQVSYTTYDSEGKLIRHYKYVDAGLADYTKYDYQIQVIRAAVPISSILSDVLTARTKADKGYPTITLGGVTETTMNTYDEGTGDLIGSINKYSLLVYPDTSSTVSVSIEESYAQTPRYQWQKQTADGWEDMAGAIKATYTFSNSGVSDEGEYRCRFNVIYEDEDVGQIYYISAYSNTFTLEYTMRTPKLVDSSFVVDLVNKTASLSLKSGHTNHTFAPSGNVTFTIKGVDYESSYTVGLGNASADYVTTALLNLGAKTSSSEGVYANLPDGVYEISAYYSGSRVFSSLIVSDSVYYVSGNSHGYLLNVNSSFTYGDDITPKLMYVSVIDGEVVASEESTGVTYKAYNEQLKTKTVTYAYKYWFFTFYRTVTYTTYEFVERPNFIKTGGSVTARSVGKYKLKAYKNGVEVATEDIIVTQKDLTIGFTNALTGVAGNPSISHPTSDILTVKSGELVGNYSDTIANLGLVVKAYNTAGTAITFSSLTDPGLYTMVGAAAPTPGTNYGNYNITYATSTYTLTGPKYDMTIVSTPYGNENAIVGTVAIIKPEVKEDNGSFINMTTTATNSSWYRDDLFAGGTAITLRATPQIGYQVKSWTVTTDNLTTTTDTSSTTFAYQTTANNTIINVTYKLAQNKLYFQAANSSVNGGTVVAVGNSIQSGAVVQQNANLTFVATPAEGYHFVEWTLSGSTNSNFTGNYDETTGTSTTTITMGSVNTILSAVFKRDSYTMTLQSNLQVTYLVDDGFGNMVSRTSTGIVTILGDTSVTVTPKTGYSLLGSAAWYINGVSVGTGYLSYTLTVLSDTTVDVGTNQNIYDVTVSVSQPSTSTKNAVAVKVNNAITDFSETRTVSGGSALVFTAIPAWGYVFHHWEINGVTSTVTAKILTLAELGETTSVVAVFIQNPNSYTINVSNNLGGELTYSVNYQGSGYSGNAPKDAAIATNGAAITVYEGDTVAIKAIPASNYMLRSWTVENVVDESPQTSLTLEAISKNVTVAARFISMSFATVTYTADSGGNITSAKSNGVAFSSGAIIGNGTKVVLTAVPDSGKMISHWTVDNKTVKTADNTTFVGEILTIESLAASNLAQIMVYFTTVNEKALTYDLTHVTVNRTYSPETYTGKTPSTETIDYVQSGTKAVFTASPEVGYRITTFTVGGVNGTENVDGTWSYTINGVTSNLDVVATASQLYTVSVDSSLANGNITIGTLNDGGQAIAGETITLASINPDLDYTFNKWSYNNTTIEGNIFTMPSENTTVSASFTAIESIDVSYSVYDTNGSEAGGNNGSISAEIARYIGGASVSGYPITNSNGNLTVNRGYSDAYVTWPDALVTFKAAPDSGYKVKYWHINGVEVTTDTANCTIGMNALTLEAIQGSEDTYTVQVQYELIGNKITYSAANAYGTIIGARLTSQYGEQTDISSGHTLTINGSIKFTATIVNDGYQVEGWYVNGVKQAGEKGLIYTYTATDGIGAAVSVNFERVSYSVSYSGENGTITAAINSTTISESPANVVGDSSVTFTAVAGAGYAFNHWTVDGEISSVTTNSLTLVITADTTVTANFTEDENCIITYNVTGNGGTLTATKGGNTFTSNSTAAANDVITFTAVPETISNGGANNYRVASWTVGGTTIATNNTTREVTVSAAISVSVTFERYDYVVTYSVTDGTGEISTVAGTSVIESLDRVEMGESVNFTAIPESGYQVLSWTINGTTITTENTTYTINNLTVDITVTVAFEQIQTYTISITTSGTGYGSVTANTGEAVPNATSVTVPRHGTVTLTALRYNTSNAFNGWTVPENAACIAGSNGIVLTLSDVTGPIIIDASFKPATMIELSASETDANGTLNYGNVQVGYKSADLMKTVNLATSSSVQITSGMDVVITAVPAIGYMVKQWIVNHVVQQELSKTLILSGVSVDTAIEVIFEPIVLYDIPSSGIGECYTITPGLKIPNDVGSDSQIRDRGAITFIATPNEGYYFKELTICGVDCLNETSSSQSTSQNIVSVVVDDNGSYIITIANVKATMDYTINAVIPIVDIIAPTNGAITVTYVDGNGTTQTVTTGSEIAVGTELTLTATADAGYYLKAWGNDMVGKMGSEILQTVTKVENITISAEFAQPVVTVPVPTKGTIAVSYVDENDETITLTDTNPLTPDTFTIPVGTVLTITGTSDIGYYLHAWGGTVTGKHGTQITLNVPEEDVTISATFLLANLGGGGGAGGFIPGGGIPANKEIITTQTLNNNDGSTTTTATITLEGTVTGNTATMSMDDQTLQTLLERLKAEQEKSSSGSGSIIMDGTVSNDVTKNTVELTLSSLRSIIDETAATLTFMTHTAVVVLDQTAMSAIANGADGNTVTLSIEEVDKKTLSQEVQNTIGDAFVLDLTITHSNGTISDFAGGKATVRVPVPETMMDEDVKVFYIADDGTLTEVNGFTIILDGVKYYQFTTEHFSYYALIKDTSLPLVDITEGNWYYNAVAYVYKNKIMTGTSSTTFEPNATTTRGMLVTVLWRIAGEPKSGSNSFIDVAPGTWYNTAVNWASENGIVDGIGGSLFAPRDNITREQMAVILYNFAHFMGYDLTEKGNTSEFIDSANISPWALNAIEWAVSTELISGKGDRILDPTGTATRAEIAMILTRFFENIKK